MIVSLTSAGRALRRKAQHVPNEVVCASGCELDELADLTRRLQALRTNVAQHLEA